MIVLKRLLVLYAIILLLIILIPGLLIILLNLNDAATEIIIYNYQSKEEMNLSLDNYLRGVVAAEMPASFPLEALKAQAVAARTYALRKKVQGQRITTASKFDQAWLSQKALLNKWQQNNFFINWSKISRAVEETKGLVLTYQGRLITAAYHSTSGGETATAKEVWGNKVPYLKSVSSLYEGESPYYAKEDFFSWQELAHKLKTKEERELTILKRSNSGRVLKIMINNKIFSGREIRGKLNLNSTKFSCLQSKKGVKFIVDGFGHGVGMSQYGAQGLAQQGYSFREILAHYYPQAEIVVGKNDFDV